MHDERRGQGDKRLVCVLWYLDSDVHIVVSIAKAVQSGDSPARQPHPVVRLHPLRNLRGRGVSGDEREGKTLVDISFLSQLFLTFTMMCPLSPGIRTSPPRIACVKLIFAFECMSNPSR